MLQALDPLDATSLLTTLGTDQVGHLPGRRAGRVFVAHTRNRHLVNGVTRAEELLSRYGHGKAIVLARFIPVVRTVLNPLAGIAGVPTRTFALWQVIGGLVWTAGLVLGGYALGPSVTHVDRYLLPLVGVIVAVSLLPLALEVLRSRRRARTVAELIPGSSE
ncbi:DedA family protein [Streptomyces sp. NPDC002577]